jgi:serine/threonine-protein kinase
VRAPDQSDGSKPDEAPEAGHGFGHGIFPKKGRGKKEPTRNVPLRARDLLGKYRIVRRIGGGGFSRVYEAVDKVEGTHVALKVPRADFVTEANLEQFRREVRTHASLDHPNILPIKNADLIGEVFVIAVPLGKGSLADRMRKRMSIDTFLGYARQMIEAVAHAHRHRIVHCDVKPENFLLFDGDRLRLADFGIAKIAQRTLKGSGSGTIGYIAPEQAMGKPKFASDVFSLGLICWEMLTGELPEYPFLPPLPGLARLRRKVPEPFIVFLARTLSVDPGRRFADAGRMLAAFERLEASVRRFARGERVRRARKTRPSATTKDWRLVRFRQFTKVHRGDLALDRTCTACDGPMSEPMHCCPWCGAAAEPAAAETRFPARCERCQRGRKLDWKFCAWCYGKGFDEVAERHYSDLRYTGRCEGCRGPVMPFSRYCPWCRRKSTRSWKIVGVRDTCPRCGWGVAVDYWSRCPWCSAKLGDGS